MDRCAEDGGFKHELHEKTHYTNTEIRKTTDQILNFSFPTFLNLDQPLSHSQSNAISAVVGLQFFLDVQEVEFNRGFTDMQVLPDFLLAGVFGDPTEYIDLSRRELLLGRRT